MTTITYTGWNETESCHTFEITGGARKGEAIYTDTFGVIPGHYTIASKTYKRG